MADKKNERQFIGLRDLTDASRLAAKREEAESARSTLKRDWGLNRAYYAGNQWSGWNDRAGRVETLNVDAGPKWRVRLQSNQIKPGLIHYVAQLTKTRPTITAEPDSGSDKDIKAAQMAESLYDYLWDTLQLNGKTQDALMEAGLSGGFWSIKWDALAGQQLRFAVDPHTGEPIRDEELAGVYIETLEQQLAQAGLDPAKAPEYVYKTVYVGDIRVDVMPAENVLLDPTAKRFEDCNWAICRHALDPDEIEARWGKKYAPDSSQEDFSPAPPGTREKPMGTTRMVYIMYIRPCPAVPDGRYVAWVEGPNEILQDVKWPYPFTELPLVKFPGLYMPDSVYDAPIVTDGRPTQDDINKALSQITEYRNLTIKPQVLAPFGALRQKVSGEPGAAIEFNPIGNLIPQWRDVPALPAYVFNTVQEGIARLEKLFNRMPSSRDQLPPRADSGGLLEGMQEATADQLSPVIIRLEDALARAGHLMAAYAQTYYEEERLLKIRGTGGSVQVKKFRGADIAGGFTFRPTYGTGLPRTREGKRVAIMEMIQAGLIEPRQGMKHLDLADLKGVQAKMARAEDFAYRTLDKMRRGQPINPDAMQQVEAQMEQFQQQAMQVVEMVQAGQEVDLDGDGMADNPDQIMQGIEEQWGQLQQAAQDAPWQPLPYEDKASSIEVLGDFLQTVEFEGYPPEIAQIFTRRFELLMQAIQAEQQPDPANLPKISLLTKSTVSAPVVTKILQQHGIDVTEDEVKELPMDTEVYNSLDKPDVGESGNDPLTEEEAAQAQQIAEDEHVAAQAKAAADMARAAAEEDRAEEAHEQKIRHAEEQHLIARTREIDEHEETQRQKEEAHRKQQSQQPSQGK